MLLGKFLKPSALPLTVLLVNTQPAKADPVNPALRPGGSSEVLYSFPNDSASLSVPPSGNAQVELQIPTFPGFVAPRLSAVYSGSGDGPLGVGWAIGIPSLELNFENTTDALSVLPNSQLQTDTRGHAFLSGRWAVNPGGKLVCEEPPGGATSIENFWCFTNPRTPIRYRVNSLDTNGFEGGFVAQDPHEGITQEYGLSPATQIQRADGRTVVWLLSRESNVWGQEVRHYYEESDSERLRTAVLMGGNKVVRFVYETKTSGISSNYRLSVLRRSSHLLTEIQLIQDCQPAQHEDGGSIWTEFPASCGAASNIVEKIKISYDADPTARFTGRYVMRAWQHMSGDESVAYGPVTFEYEGDTVSAYGDGLTTSSVVGSAESTAFSVPSGHSFANGAFYNYMDFNRDGVSDWISTKTDDSAYSVSYETEAHVIKVRQRKADSTFQSSAEGIEYDDPLSRHAFWLWKNGETFALRANRMDKFCTRLTLEGGTYYYVPPQTPVNPSWSPSQMVAEAYSAGWDADATVGINSRPWLHVETDSAGDSSSIGLEANECRAYYDGEYEEEHNGAPPIFSQLSMTVPCERLGSEICGQLKEAYNCVWRASGSCANADPDDELYEDGAAADWANDHLGVKLTDLVDMNGDGYLDRVVSGLLVLWDADGFRTATGYRNGDTSDPDPAVYVSFFDPNDGANGAFQPFEKYAIAIPEGPLANYPAFLSALAVEYTHDAEPGSRDMSNQGAASAWMSLGILGMSLFESGFSQASASSVSPTGVLGFAAAVGQFALSQQAHEVSASPAIKQALAYSGLYSDALSTGMNLGSLPGRLATYADILSEFGARGLSPYGWASLGSSIFGAAGAVAGFAVQATAGSRVGAPGYNAAVVAENAKTANALIGLVTNAAVLSASVFLLVQGSVAFGPLGAVVGALIAITYAVIALVGPDGSLEFSDGSVPWSTLVHRGIKWRDTSGAVADHYLGKNQGLLTWMDVTGDGRVDLVVGRRSLSLPGYYVAPGNVTKGYTTLTTQAFRRYQFEDAATTPTAAQVDVLTEAKTDTHFELGKVHRGDQTDTTLAVVDMNGDGLVDVVESGSASTGVMDLRVHLNTGTGFAAAVTWEQAASTQAPGSGPNAISRSRSLSWTEFVDNTSGYSLSLSATTQTLLDLNRDGLPDLVWRDETTAGEISATGVCAKSGQVDSDMSDDPMPVYPEPGYGEPCAGTDHASDVWFANLDGGYGDANAVSGEGASHLTNYAKALFSPKSEAYHYVAFNTGNGFSAWVKIDKKIPAFGGGFSIQSTVNESDYATDYALGGQTNLLADPEANGQPMLISLDMDSALLASNQPSPGAAPVVTAYPIGIAHPDALTRVTYPEGGMVTFAYDLKKDIGGEQGPPRWVLSRASFDDQIAESWGDPSPYIDYSYTGGKLRDREFLGFEAVGETRYSGTDVTQVISVFSQEGPGRGSIACTESRGTTLYDGEVLPNGSAVNPSCGSALASRSGTPAQQTAVGCYAEADALLGGAYPIQKFVQYGYLEDGTTYSLLEDGTTDEVVRDAVVTSTETSVLNGSNTASTTTLVVSYEGQPAFSGVAYRVPVLSENYSTVGGSLQKMRSVATDWQHHTTSDEWLLAKQTETKFAYDEATSTDVAVFQTTWNASAAYPYPLESMVQRDSVTGEERRTLYGTYVHGMPTQITEGGTSRSCTTTYSYYADSQDGTGRLHTVQGCTDSNRLAGVESFVYDAMGRVLSHTTAGGVINTFHYDALGVLDWDSPAGGAVRSYSHANVGSPGFGRNAADLAVAQRTERSTTEAPLGETITEVTYWDGFYRKFRTGLRASGTRTVTFARDGGASGTIETHSFSDDQMWFTSQGATELLADLRLNAVGEVQCASLPYLDGHAPEAWSSTLFDSERRATFAADVEGFRAWTTYSVDSTTSHPMATTTDDGAVTHVVESDALGRKIAEDHAGLAATSYEYNDWDGLVRSTNKAGYRTIRELNAWNQPTKTCSQVDFSFPLTTNACPTDDPNWPTVTTAYDDFGLASSVTDANGNVTTYDNGACFKVSPNRINKPTVAYDGTSSYVETYFDADCRTISVRTLNGSTTENTYEPGTGRLLATTSAVGLPEESTTSFGYDGFGRALYTENGRGYRTYSVLSFRNQSLYVYPPSGNPNATYYDVKGHATVSTNALGHAVTRTYNKRGEVLTSTYSTDSCNGSLIEADTWGTSTVAVTETTARDAKGRATVITAKDGAQSETHYDDLDRITSVCLPDPATGAVSTVCTHTVYDDAGDVESTLDPMGHKVVFRYDGLGRKLEENVWLDGAGTTMLTTTYEYDANGNLTWVRSPNTYGASACVVGASGADAHSTHTTYNAWNLPVSITGMQDQGGYASTLSKSYDAAGRVHAESDARGYVTTFDYDALSRVLATHHPDGTTRSQTYDENGNVLTVTDERGIVIATNTYDARDRLVSTTPDAGGDQFFEYNDVNQKVCEGTLVNESVSNPTTNEWQGSIYTYSTDGLLVRSALGTMTGEIPSCAVFVESVGARQSCYDKARRPQASQDPTGNIAVQRYNSRGFKIADRLPRLGVSGWEEVVYTYDDNGNLLTETAPMGGTGPLSVVTTYTYDYAGRRTYETFTQSRDAKRYSYDNNGNLCALEDINGGSVTRSTTFQYDARGLSTRRVTSPGTTETFSYDPAANLVGATDASGSWAYQYNSRNWLEQQQQTPAALGTTFTTQYQYYPNGQLQTTTYPNVSGYTFYSPGTLTNTLEGSTNRVASITTTRETVAQSFTRDGLNRALGYAIGNGATVEKTYFSYGPLATRKVLFGGAYQVNQAFNYDTALRLRTVTDYQDANYTTEYDYDERGRVTDFYMPLFAGTHWYQYQYNAQNLVTQVTGPTADKNRALTYDGTWGTLTQMTLGSSTYSFGRDNWGNRVTSNRYGNQTYTYDALNRMTTYAYPSGSGTGTRNITYAHDTRRVYDGNKVYLYGSDRLPLVEISVDSSSAITAVQYNVYLGGQLAQTVNGSTGSIKFYVNNHQGSPDFVMNRLPGSYEYLAYGPYGQTIPRPALSSATSLSRTEIGFQDNYKEKTTGFNLMGHRYYDPETFAFVVSDPSGLEGGVSRYAFANGSPTRFTDRSGLHALADYQDHVDEEARILAQQQQAVLVEQQLAALRGAPRVPSFVVPPVLLASDYLLVPEPRRVATISNAPTPLSEVDMLRGAVAPGLTNPDVAAQFSNSMYDACRPCAATFDAANTLASVVAPEALAMKSGLSIRKALVQEAGTSRSPASNGLHAVESPVSSKGTPWRPQNQSAEYLNLTGASEPIPMPAVEHMRDLDGATLLAFSTRGSEPVAILGLFDEGGAGIRAAAHWAHDAGWIPKPGTNLGLSLGIEDLTDGVDHARYAPRVIFVLDGFDPARMMGDGFTNAEFRALLRDRLPRNPSGVLFFEGGKVVETEAVLRRVPTTSIPNEEFYSPSTEVDW